MFTGIIRSIGSIKKIETNESGKKISIHCPQLIDQITLGDSIAVNGVCLTAEKIEKESFHAHLIHSTLAKTTFKFLNENEPVNLELALRMGQRLGGHLVQGHVNGLGQIKSISQLGENYLIKIQLNENLHHYCVKEGSITVDGISLTIADIDDDEILLSIIPHTWYQTVTHLYQPKQFVNIEVDVIIKYLEKLSLPYLRK